jgi:prepilin-type N-terminal cleavage/methylation domain-containing protein
MYEYFMGTRHHSAAFTLVELLAVIGIMGLLAVVAVPALKGLTGSGGRKQALGQVIGALELARNTAISTATNAAVIFPTQTLTNEGYAFRTMAVVTWGNNTNGNGEMVGGWIALPQGIAFFPGSLAATNLVTATNITYQIVTQKITNGTFNAVIFGRDGGLVSNNQNFPTNGVAFFEGTVENGTAKTNTAQPKFERVKLARYTGRVIPTLTNAP